MSRRRSRLHGLQQSLADVLGEDTFAQLESIARIRRAWADIVGPMMAARCEPLSIEHVTDGGLCLWVGVDHPIIAQQIRFLHEEIRKACLKQTRLGRLRRIRTRVVPQAGIRPRSTIRPARQPVSWGTRRAIAKSLSGIKDRRLRHAMFEARMAQIAFATQTKEQS